MPMAVGTFLASMDYTIVASSFAAIGSDLKQLQNTSWIATGYMLTSTSFQCVCYASCSGRVTSLTS